MIDPMTLAAVIKLANELCKIYKETVEIKAEDLKKVKVEDLVEVKKARMAFDDAINESSIKEKLQELTGLLNENIK